MSATGPAASPTRSSTAATDTPQSSEPGVLETTRQAVPPNAQVCGQDLSGQTAVAAVADPAAPRITVAVPDGWSAAPGSGDVGARFTEPGVMLAEISITATPLDPAAAFTRYSDDLMAKYPISTLSLLPADLCGYSGQKLMGTWADDPEESMEYQDQHHPHLDQREELPGRHPRRSALGRHRIRRRGLGADRRLQHRHTLKMMAH